MKVNIERARVLARLGHAAGKTVIDEKTESLITEETAVAQKLISPKQVSSSSVILETGPGHVRLEPGFEIASRDIAALLAGCDKAVGFAVTIGPHLEEKRNAYIKEGQTARALILDAIGSVAAEELAAAAHALIRAESAKEGLTATKRFSPGYGDWPVSSQREFLKWLGAELIGIKLNAGAQMEPEKSVSAILGVKK
jgi:hypothetical protein